VPNGSIVRGALALYDAEHIRFEAAVLAFKSLHEQSSSYLQLTLLRRPSDHVELGCAHRCQAAPFHLRYKLSTVGDRAFPVAGAVFLNSLSQHVKSATSLKTFRSRLRTFSLIQVFISRPYCLALFCFFCRRSAGQLFSLFPQCLSIDFFQFRPFKSFI
jgi:hypothetical protein